MHPNPAFRGVEPARNIAFADARGFGLLTMNGPDGPLAAHLPFVIEGDRVRAHVARSNPLRKALEAGPQPALLAVSGPDGYVSPDWYGIDDQVPTWNYVAVHLRGALGLAPPESLRGHLAALSARFESRLAPKPAWTLDKMTDAALSRLERMILPIEMRIAQADGTWKLGQNKPEAARRGAAEAMAHAALGAECAALADMMRNA